jgi:O-6-methylguanine DNA methyltransferase
MKNYLHHYLSKLSKSGTGLVFSSVVCNYGIFIIYCHMGPEENIIQVTFSLKKHEWLQRKLKQLNSGVQINNIQQKDFRYNTMFEDYFTGKCRKLPNRTESPLLAAGTDFQQRVWHSMMAIPYGGKITYQQLAEQSGSPKGARAAGMACGANPLALIIPCHRVVATNGLGGFGGGVKIKKALLALEYSQGNAGL